MKIQILQEKGTMSGLARSSKEEESLPPRSSRTGNSREAVVEEPGR